MRAYLALFLILPACSDYELTPEAKLPDGEEPVDAPPDILVTPASITALHCGAQEHEITVQNEGEGPLQVSSVTIDGEGWSLEGPSSFTLQAAESQLLRVGASEGTATLTVNSDDPDEAQISIPLQASADQPPEVAILSPAGGEVLEVDASVPLLGEVSDDADPPESLGVLWSSSASGTISNQAADSLGSLSATWLAEQRSEGIQQLSLEVADSCGNSSQDTISVCQQAGYTEDSVDLEAWHFEGSAFWDSAEGWLQLAGLDTYATGTAFETGHQVTGEAVEIQFQFYMGDGSGADGFSLTALDVDRMTGFMGASGCGLGYGEAHSSCIDSGEPLPGWSLEVDTWYNDGIDPTSEDHVAFTFDGDLDSIAAWSSLPEMADTGWHSMSIVVAAPHITVAIDGLTYIDRDVEGYFAFPAYVGFTAATGASTNYHLIDALEVTEYVCEE